MEKLEVPTRQDGKSLLLCITQMLPGIRRGDAKKILKSGDIKVNGVRTKNDEAVHAGDLIEVYIPASIKPYPKPDIVYEDKNLIIVNKDAGISVVQDRDDGKPALGKLIAEYMREQGIYSEETGSIPFACHRLDHNTGGLTIFAKNERYFDFVSQAISQRLIAKYYKTIVVGKPPKDSDELTGFLEKDADASLVRITSRPTKTALSVVTRYTVLKTNGQISLLEVELVTGRTHQIRAHLADIGIPVLGDDKYGDRKANKKYGVNYQALWATKLVFHTGTDHPLAYLDGMVVQAYRTGLPYVGL